MKKFSKYIPQTIENLSASEVINYEIRESSNEEIQMEWDAIRVDDMSLEPDESFIDEHKFTFYQTIVPMGLWTRDGIVNAIIRDKYRIDEMEAITNNMAAITAVFLQTLVSDGIVSATKYLKESINDANTARFKEMQEWRAMAKKVAKSIIKE